MSNITDLNKKEVYLNGPQLKVNMVAARETYCVWGRGTGKSQGVLAPAQIRNMASMPRSLGINLGATFAQILTRTLPAIIQAWEQLGYRRDEHYFIGHYAPKSWNWPKPYFAPIDARYLIHWNTGAAIQMVSQDGYGMSNGISADYLHGDEAKLLNHEKLKTETLPILRGNSQYFGNLSQHQSIIFTTDRPTSSSSAWILDKAKEHNEEYVKLILQVQMKMQRMLAVIDTLSEKGKKEYRHELATWDKKLNLLRMNTVMYSEASALDNVHVLGENYFKQQKRNLSQFEFETAILNMKPRTTEKSFYPLFDENIHTYEKYNHSHFESVGWDFDKLSSNDCRKDGDLDPRQALDISIDYGASINIMAVAQQRNDNQEDVIKEFFVKSPGILQDVLEQFVNYYRFHRYKLVNYYFDHTAIAQFGHTSKSYRDTVTAYLKANGWDVKEVYTGQAPKHEEKHAFWNDVLNEKQTAFPRFRLNRSNCPALKKSIEDAGWINTSEGFKKDKSTERNNSVPQEYATHGSDAVDMLMWGKFRKGFTRQSSEFIPNTYG